MTQFQAIGLDLAASRAALFAAIFACDLAVFHAIPEAIGLAIWRCFEGGLGIFHGWFTLIGWFGYVTVYVTVVRAVA